MSVVEVIKAEYSNPKHQSEIIALLHAYASDPMGGGEGLSEHAKQHLVAELAKLPHAFTLIAYVDGEPAGLANCFEGYSTFACKPIVNVHDLVVLKSFRGLGLSHRILDKVEELAVAKGCCKVTLEVLSNNEVAKASYQKFGFAGYELDPEAGHALFWEKKLPI
tara:strand:+ start:687 stop:1178 length:492 start_codon:yes stop_codon:yes gene_type:complete